MKRPVWKVFAVSAAIALVPIGAAALWVRSAADRKIAAMEEKLRALEAESLAPDPTPRPGRVPGNAWDDYIGALSETTKLRSPETLIGIVERKQNADLAFGEAALTAHGSAVDLIVSGSRRATCIPPGRPVLPALWNWETAIRLAILQARRLHEQGKTPAAVEILLALCQFGCDLGQSGVPYASHFPYPALEMPLKELTELLRGGELSVVTIARIDSWLAELDRSFPPSERMRKKQLQLIATMNVQVQNYGPGAVLLSWRYGFSPRLLVGTLFEQWEHWFTRTIAADALPWPEEQTQVAKIREEIDQTQHTRFSVPSGYLTDGFQVRTARAHLRILRTATHFRATGEVLDLDDPFGTKLLRQRDNDHIKVWSVGRDGVDQQGQGNWDALPAQDIVLEVPR
jgi:hypothetical protein